MKKKRRRQRMIRRILAISSCTLLLLIVVVGVVFAGNYLKKKISKPAMEEVTKQDAQNEDNQGTEADTANVEGLEGTEAIEFGTESTEVQSTEIEEPVTAYQTEPIPNIESLDATPVGWGQGVQFDDQNRPVSCTSYQEKYGDYNAYFIGEDTQTIYLTFDEGYENGYTSKILDTLKEKGVKAVFFVTKPYAEQNPDLIQRMIDEGHEVGNHSVNHPSDGLPSLSIDRQKEEVMGCHDYIKENFNYDMHLFRYPTGKFSEQSLALVNNCNYKSVFWSFAYLDYDVNNQPERGAALEKVTARLHPGAIYLLHAVSATNADILGDFIDQGRSAGYTFELFQ